MRTQCILLVAILACLATASSAATIDDVSSWLRAAGLRHYLVPGNGSSSAACRVPFTSDDPATGSVEVTVSSSGASDQYVFIYAKALELPSGTSADVYRHCLEADGVVDFVRYGISDGVLYALVECPWRLLDRRLCRHTSCAVGSFDRANSCGTEGQCRTRSGAPSAL